MGKTKAAQNLYNTLGTPPDDLNAQTFIVKVIGARGNSLYNVRVPKSSEAKLAALFQLPKTTPVTEARPAAQKQETEDSDSDEEDIVNELLLGTEVTVEMPPKFRNTIFVKRGGFCVISIYQEIMDLDTPPELSSYKVHGEISNIVVNDREWQKYAYWPQEFKKVTKGWDISSDEEEEEDEDDEE